MQNKSLAKLAYALFLMTTMTLFLRPAELFEWLESAQIYEVLILSTFILSFDSFVSHFRQFMLLRQPITACVAGMFVAIAISHFQYIYLGGVLDSGTLFLKTMIYFGLVITTVNTPGRLRGLLLTVAISGSLMVTMCVADFYGIYDFVFIEHLEDMDEFDEDEGVTKRVWRMRGTGIFQDPNDLTMVICATGVVCAYFLTDKKLSKLRLLWIIPMLILGIGVIATGSRGGLLACGVAGLVLLAVKYGGKIAIVACVMGVCLLPFIGGRQGSAALEEGGTAAERIMLWREGFSELKSPAILFGTGQGTYPDIAGLAAHNAFVNSYVELGLFGGTFFFGCFFFAGMQLYRAGRLKEAILHSELIRMRPFLCAMLAGWVTSIMSLSRAYTVPTYLVLGTMASYLNLIWIYTESGEPLVIWDRGHTFRLGIASMMAFCGLYVFTMVMS